MKARTYNQKNNSSRKVSIYQKFSKSELMQAVEEGEESRIRTVSTD